MKKSVLFPLSAVIAITLLSMTFISGAAISYVPGVTAGQSIKYNYVEDTDPAVEITIHVKAVSGSIVNYSKDDSASVVQYNVSYIVQSPWYFVGINLNVSDKVHGSATTGYPVTALDSAYSIAGQTWSAVRMQYSGGGITRDAYWERSTGILLYWSYSSVSMEQTYTIVSIGSDTEATPMDPTFIIASLLAGVVVAVASIRNKRRIG
jgi:hypothetical protein